MAYTVNAAFETFRGKIELPGEHRDVANKRRDSIVEILKDSFDILEAFPTGSVPRYTAVKGYADLDVMVVLHYGKHVENKLPSQVLGAVQRALSEYKTKVRRNGQAVTLSYKTWPSVDIVPVYRSGSNGKVSYYGVPDMNTETWLVSKPRTHSNNLTERNNACGATFKRLIKMIKWWNHKHSDYMQSYHIEALAYTIFTTGMGSEYPWNVFSFFDKAIPLVQSGFYYEGSYVGGYLSQSSRSEVLTRLERARDKARDAWYWTYAEECEHEKAIGIWRQVFGDAFPAYG